MKNYKTLILTGILALVFGGWGMMAQANPSQFTKGDCATSTTATTTLASYMTPGTGTSTLTCQMALTGQDAADSATLMFYFNASSTLSVLNMKVEYSNDGTNWFENNMGDLTDVGTSTAAASIGAVKSMTLQYASSTPGGANAALRNYISRIIEVKTPTPYVRVVFSATGANSAVWAQFLGKKQIK